MSLPEITLVSFFATSFLIQLFYILVIFSRLAFFKKELAAPNVLSPVSVIVAARNEADNLKRLLPALLRQNYPDYEIIIVNDRSDDDTAMILHEIKLQYAPKIRVIRIEETPEEFNGKKYALTLAIKAARHDWLLFTDADCLPCSDDWIASMSRAFIGSNQVVLGYSQYQQQEGLLNHFIRFETFYTAVQYLSLALCGRPYMGVGRNLAYRKTSFMNAKGFYKHIGVMGGDDDLLVNRLANKHNTEIVIGQNSHTSSLPKTSLKSWYLQKKRHLSVGRFYKTTDKVLLGILSASHVLYWLTAVALCLYFALQGSYELLLLLSAAILLRWLSLLLVFNYIGKKLEDSVNLLFLPLFDFMYIIYYLVVGFSAATSKKIKWK